jgi:hypothetical protein
MTKVSDDLIMHRPIGDIELDPALDVLPLMARDDFARLVDSVSRDGITHPLHVREEGQRIICLDGRNRLKAARECGLDTVPCLTVMTDNSVESALGSTINRRRLSKTGIAYFVIQANPQIRDRAGNFDSNRFCDKGQSTFHKMKGTSDMGLSMADLAEKYQIHIAYISCVVAALNACRPASKDEDVLCKLIVDDEVCAANLLKALQGWQASHPVGDGADPADAQVTKKAPVDVVGGMIRSLTFIRNQAAGWDKMKPTDRSHVLSQWDRTWALLPKELQEYAMKKGKTKDYVAALAREADLAKPIGPKSGRMG